MAKQLPVKEFFKTDLPSYGSYDNVRKICNYIDGQKISMRKILYTLMKKYNSKEKIKTETVANMTAAFTNYLHGAANLCGVCETMAQNFVGSNNYPLLIGNSGGFGNRNNPECAAPRYTQVKISDLVKKLLNEDDEAIIGRQYFEGDYIEPKFFVPVFPIVFLNGSSGMSIGFSHDIYPRNPIEIIEYIKKKINGTEHPRMQLLPWFKGHNGKVEFNKDLNKNESFGVIVKNNMTSYTVTELPIGIEPSKYNEFLEKLCENGTIQDFDNKCSTKKDTILFNIKTSRDFTKKHSDERKLMECLHLIKSLPETLTCIDENNCARDFKSVQEILDAYIDVRLKYYDLRKQYLLKSLEDSLKKLSSKYLFIKAIVDKTLVVSNKKKDEIVKQLEKMPKICKINGSYDYLLAMPISKLTKEELEELKKQIEDAKSEYKQIKETSIQTMWTNDLHELKKVL